MLLPQRRPGVKGYELSTDPEMLKFSSYVFEVTNQLAVLDAAPAHLIDGEDRQKG